MTKRIIRSALSLSILSTIVSFTYANEEKISPVSEPVKLETIVVSASGFEQDVKQAAASISVLTQEQINKKDK